MASGRPDVPPPGYFERQEFPPDYNTSAERHYTINGQTLYSPLILEKHVKAHLCLLRAVHDLQATIEGGQDTRIPQDALKLDTTQRWAWFVGLAVERFTRWVKTVRLAPLREWVQREMPPLDVLMVWHAYTLNPIWYVEDTDRLPMLKTLKGLGGRLLSCLVEIGDVGVYLPSNELQNIWFDRTACPYDPLDAMSTLKFHRLECPQCTTGIDTPFISADGTGYLQHGFAVQCANCSIVLTREALSVVKFARDFVIDPHSREDKEVYGNGVFMAGTYWSLREGPGNEQAEATKIGLQDCFPLSRPKDATHLSAEEWRQHIHRVTSVNMTPIKAAILSQLTTKGYNVQRVLSAYSDDRPFSVNLVGAVMRQSTFTDRLFDLQWTDEQHFGEDSEDHLVLEHAISRYHAFLDLVSTAPQTIMFVPTIDIDLIWHTHQMMGSTYIAHCAKYIKCLVDHYDIVERLHLASAYDRTCRAWRERFGVPYSFCGCPLPGDKVAERVTRLKQLVLHPKNPGGELVPLRRPDATLATHPSDHNAYPIAGVDSLEKRRVQKVAKRARRDHKKGEHADAHDPAFLTPLAIYTNLEDSAIFSGGVANEFVWIKGAGSGGDINLSKGIPYGGFGFA